MRKGTIDPERFLKIVSFTIQKSGWGFWGRMAAPQKLVKCVSIKCGCIHRLPMKMCVINVRCVPLLVMIEVKYKNESVEINVLLQHCNISCTHCASGQRKVNNKQCCLYVRWRLFVFTINRVTDAVSSSRFVRKSDVVKIQILCFRTNRCFGKKTSYSEISKVRI